MREIYKKNAFIIECIWTKLPIENMLQPVIPQKMALRLFKYLIVDTLIYYKTLRTLCDFILCSGVVVCCYPQITLIGQYQPIISDN